MTISWKDAIKSAMFPAEYNKPVDFVLKTYSKDLNAEHVQTIRSLNTPDEVAQLACKVLDVNCEEMATSSAPPPTFDVNSVGRVITSLWGPNDFITVERESGGTATIASLDARSLRTPGLISVLRENRGPLGSVTFTRQSDPHPIFKYRYGIFDTDYCYGSVNNRTVVEGGHLYSFIPYALGAGAFFLGIKGIQVLLKMNREKLNPNSPRKTEQEAIPAAIEKQWGFSDFVSPVSCLLSASILLGGAVAAYKWDSQFYRI